MKEKSYKTPIGYYLNWGHHIAVEYATLTRLSPQFESGWPHILHAMLKTYGEVNAAKVVQYDIHKFFSKVH